MTLRQCPRVFDDSDSQEGASLRMGSNIKCEEPEGFKPEAARMDPKRMRLISLVRWRGANGRRWHKVPPIGH